MNQDQTTDRGRSPGKVRAALVAAGLSAGLVGGGLAGAVLGTSGISGAQEGGGTTTTVVPAPDRSPADTPDGERPDPGTRLQEILQPLVDDGTLTQAQADKVIERLKEAGPPRGGHGPGHGRLGKGLDEAAEALGISESELRTELRSGKTLAQVAEERGVDKQTVIDALVAEVKEHLDEEVAEGDLTQAQADERLQEATERITDGVDNGFRRGPGRGGPGGGDDRPADGGGD